MARFGLGPQVLSAPRIVRHMRTMSVSPRIMAVLAVPTVFLLLWTAALQIPNNVLELSRTSAPARVLVSAFPQGWAFFTRSPQEEQLRVYADALPLRLLDRAPYGEPSNAFGLDRGARKQTAELALILTRVQETDWRPCGSDAECVAAAGPPKPVDNPTQEPSYCGAVVVIGSNIVPWGYRELLQTTYQNVRAIRLLVRCMH